MVVSDSRADPDTLYGELRREGVNRPQAIAMVSVESDGAKRRMTFGELLDRVDRLSAGLVAIGVRPGDRLGLLMSNLIEWPLTFFAAMRVGAVVVPVSTFLKAAEIVHILSSAEVRHLVAVERAAGRDFSTPLLDSCPELYDQTRWTVRSPRLPELRSIVVLARPGSAGRRLPSFDLEEVMGMASDTGAGAAAQEMESAVTGSDLAMIKYTSGSTGWPKGVMLRQGPLVRGGRAIRDRLDISPTDVFCTTAPMFHMSGSAWGFLAVMTGGTAFVTPELPDPVATVNLMEEEGCTIRFGFPANYLKEVELPDVEKRNFRVRALCGRPPSLVEERLRPVFGFDLAFSPYGLTEAYGPVTVQAPGCPPSEQSGHSCGRVLDGQEVRICSIDCGLPVPDGDVGEICVRGRVMDGYWKDEAATAKVLDPEGWLHTEDFGWLAPDGSLHFVGRARSRLKVGGENVSVEEIERLIVEAPGVRDAVVVALVDEVYGQVPFAFVKCDPGVQASAVIDHCRAQGAWYKVPTGLHVMDEFPLLGNGKPDRVEMERTAARLRQPVGRS